MTAQSRPEAIASARDRIALVADPGSFEPWDEDVVSDDPLGFADSKPYRERLAAAEERTGAREAVLTGRATLGGRPIVAGAGEFSFLGRSSGVAAGERVARGLDPAREQRLPVIGLAASGGKRMQEGSRGLRRMRKLGGAVRRRRDAGVPYIVY